MNKKILIGAGILAAVGLAYYLWKKKESSETTVTGGEKKANAFGRVFSSGKMAKVDCPVGCECYGGKANCFAQSNALGRIGGGMSLAPTILNATVGNCTADQIAKGTHINCSSKGVAGFCCLAPKPAATLTIVN